MKTRGLAPASIVLGILSMAALIITGPELLTAMFSTGATAVGVVDLIITSDRKQKVTATIGIVLGSIPLGFVVYHLIRTFVA